MGGTSLLMAGLLSCGPMAEAAGLAVERMDLGEAPGEQAYNLQELADLRVFALSAADFRQARIHVQRRVDGQWQPAQALPFSDPRWRDSDPHLSADVHGRVLTFVSNRPGPAGREHADPDLYESRWHDGRWSAPQRLPEAWQSPSYELGPERYGDTVYLASSRPGGPGAVSIYRVQGGDATPQPLPAPVNDGGQNSDFTLSPDGHYVLWWSDRAGAEGGEGDIYLAERVGESYGPALRLPAPVNGPGFEFTPSISADGRWLYFASTRGDAQGLSHVYRVSWPALLEQLGPAATTHSQTALDGAVSALWRAIGHAPGQASDVRTLTRLLHAEARVFGQSLQASSLQVRSASAGQFLADMAQASGQGLYECEIERRQKRFGGHAQVYSVVQTRRDPDQRAPAYTGVNSMQWQLGPHGWQLLSLHYALEGPGLRLPLPLESACLG
ncbi:TolB family protein [Roseateles sp.]|uniref:TolB family protein n=1 Tax=Roseateles sp. TaxID=1971397 RepID=UPI0039E7D7FC